MPRPGQVMDRAGRNDEGAAAAPGLVIRSARRRASSPAPTSGIHPIDSPANRPGADRTGWTLFNRLAAVPLIRRPALVRPLPGRRPGMALACRYRRRWMSREPGWAAGGDARASSPVGVACCARRSGGRPPPDWISDAHRQDRRCPAGEADGPRRRGCVPRDDGARRPGGCSPAGRGGSRRSCKGCSRARSRRWRRPARKQVARKADPEHYPAPRHHRPVWAQHGGNALAAPQILDRVRRFAHRPQSGPRLFPQGAAPKAGQGPTSGRARPRGRRWGDGGDVAAWWRPAGFIVSLQDQDIARIAPARPRQNPSIAARPLRCGGWLIADPRPGAGVAHADVYHDRGHLRGCDAAALPALSPCPKPDAILAEVPPACGWRILGPWRGRNAW